MTSAFDGTLTGSVADALEILRVALANEQNHHRGETAPTSPVEGMLWTFVPASGNPALRIYHDSQWVVIAPNLTDAGGGLARLDAATFINAISGVAATADAHFPIASQVNGRKKVVTVSLGGLAASRTLPIGIIPVSARWTVEAVRIVSDTATTGSDAGNRWDFGVQRYRSGTPTAMQSVAGTTNGAELAAWIPKDLGVDQNNAPAELDALDVLVLEVTKTGSPTDLASAELTVQIELLEKLF